MDARNLSQDAASSILPNALGYMQVGSLANLVSSNMNALSSEQLSSITNSDVYASLTSSVQSLLNTEIDSTGSTTSTKNSSKRPGTSWFTLMALVASTVLALNFSPQAN